MEAAGARQESLLRSCAAKGLGITETLGSSVGILIVPRPSVTPRVGPLLRNEERSGEGHIRCDPSGGGLDGTDPPPSEQRLEGSNPF